MFWAFVDVEYKPGIVTHKIDNGWAKKNLQKSKNNTEIDMQVLIRQWKMFALKVPYNIKLKK